MIDRLLATVFQVLLQADLDGMNREEARAMLPTLRMLFKDLVTAHREETLRQQMTEGGEVVPFSADELRAAQVELTQWQTQWQARGNGRGAGDKLIAATPGVAGEKANKSNGEAQRALRDVLATLYPDEASARRVVAQAGLDGKRIGFCARAVDTWQAVLTEAVHGKALDRLMAVAVAEYGAHEPLLRAVARNQRGKPRRGRPRKVIGGGVGR